MPFEAYHKRGSVSSKGSCRIDMYNFGCLGNLHEAASIGDHLLVERAGGVRSI